ncbi:MAG: PAS domain-containing protein [Deltaproteobacteria bacterium]|nr:PAS domain-containing protein [Deltaproteobacteria bacterium]
MEKSAETIGNKPGRSPLNLAIVGGGRACKFFLDLIQHGTFPYLDIHLVGVCDINPEAEGFCLAKEMGIYTTNNFQDLFRIKDLDGVIELTNNRDVIPELIRLRPKGAGVLEHIVGRFIRRLFEGDQGLKSAEQHVALVKMASDFFIQQTNERIVVLNPDFTIVEANEAYLKVVGKSKKDVIGAHCYEITHGFSAPCSSLQPDLGCPMVETLRTGESAQAIHEHPTSGESRTYCDMVTYPLKNESGEIDRIIEVWRDITEEISPKWERWARALKADLRKLVQEDRMISLGKLVASSVHEINNPIQGLLTFSHLMQEILKEGTPGPDDLKKFQYYLSLMSSELERCGNIISGLLSFSRQSSMEYKDVDLNEVLGQVISLTSHKMEIQNIQLRKKFSSSPLMVNGDVNQLQQCFLNLIFNAIEAMPQGGQLSVISEWDNEQKNARLEFRDTGCGISEKNLDHIFDPFFTTKEEGAGTGLGLSIMHGVVKAHKGEIKVKSRVGKGSSFILNFPIK